MNAIRAYLLKTGIEQYELGIKAGFKGSEAAIKNKVSRHANDRCTPSLEDAQGYFRASKGQINLLQPKKLIRRLTVSA